MLFRPYAHSLFLLHCRRCCICIIGGHEYTPQYCLQLEAAYGEGMMSEGGSEAIEWMFDLIPIEGKMALDIGSGLGGVPLYLAKQYGMHVTGLEVNPWMVGRVKKKNTAFPERQSGFFAEL